MWELRSRSTTRGDGSRVRKVSPMRRDETRSNELRSEEWRLGKGNHRQMGMWQWNSRTNRNGGQGIWTEETEILRRTTDVQWSRTADALFAPRNSSPIGRRLVEGTFTSANRSGPISLRTSGSDGSHYPICTFWNLGDRSCDGVRVQIRQDVFHQMSDLYQALATKVGCLQGVRGLYSPQGTALTDLTELTDGLDVVVAPSGYAFEKCFLPRKLAKKVGFSS
jgi:hypothetical protein